MWKKAWLASVATMVSGAMAWGQAGGSPGFPAPIYPPVPPPGPVAPNPNVPPFGYPSFPQAPNVGTPPNIGAPGIEIPGAPGAPGAPFGVRPPGAPYAPTGPYPPVAPYPPAPTYSVPNSTPNAPYLVTPDAAGKPTLPPSASPGPGVLPTPIATYDGVDNFEACGPNEPYTLYEGKRYLAEVKNDCTCMWVRANYIHWWVRGDSTPPLVTTGTGANAAVIGDPGTAVLLGGGAIGPKQFNGIQGTVGFWCDPERLCAIEFGGFWVGKNSRGYGFTSDTLGNPSFAQPVLAPNETALFTTLPGVFAGSIRVDSIMDFHGFEVNKVHNAYRLCGWSIDWLCGVRYMYLNDHLAMNQSINVLQNGALPFAGAIQGPGSAFQLYDSFNATNRFYGAQLGARVYWTHCKWDMDATFKIAFGATTHTVVIDGSTTLTDVAGTTTTTTGGSLAQSSNIGRHGGTDFSCVPELNMNIGYEVIPHVRLLAGYNVLYWTRVARAGEQIDRRIDLTQSPTDGSFVPNRVGTTPVFLNQRSDFWAQGFSLGVEFKY